MTRTIAALALLLAAGTAAAAEPATCHATITGAVEASFDCTVLAAAKDKGAQLTITANGPVAGVKAITVADFTFPAQLRIGRFDDETRPAGTSRLETAKGEKLVAGAGTDMVIVNLDSVEKLRTGGRYLVSGSVEIALVPEKGNGPGAKLKVHF